MPKLITFFLLYFCCINAYSIIEDSEKLPAKGIYTSIEEIDKNQPKHNIELSIRKYNTVDIYFIKKAKLKLLNNALAISDGKDFYVCIGDYRNKKGFVLTNYENRNLNYSNEHKIVTNKYIPGYYKTYRFNKPIKIDSSINIVKRGRKSIYQLENDDRKKLDGIAAVSDGKDVYVKMGRYHGKPAFAKTVLYGKYHYLETEWSIVNEEAILKGYNYSLQGYANTQLMKEIPKKEKVGIIVDTKKIELFITRDRFEFRLDKFAKILCEHPKLLIEFINSNRKSSAKKMIIDKINSLEI